MNDQWREKSIYFLLSPQLKRRATLIARLFYVSRAYANLPNTTLKTYFCKIREMRSVLFIFDEKNREKWERVQHEVKVRGSFHILLGQAIY